MKKIFCVTLIVFLFSSICLAGEWNLTGSLNQGSEEFSSVILDDGRVLKAGASMPSNESRTCEIWDPATELWTLTDSMAFGREGYNFLVKLPDGRVLATGFGGPNHVSEIWDPVTELWTQTEAMNYLHEDHCTVLFVDGQGNASVLVIGGDLENDYQGCEIWNPTTGLWSLTGFLPVGKRCFPAILLPNGDVMAVGGGISGYDACATYDHITGLWTEIAPLNLGRLYCTLELLPNGDVMAIAGVFGNIFLNSCEIYDFQTEEWAFTDSLEIGRTNHCSEILLNNKILVMGGHSDQIGTDTTCEIYDYENNQWQIAASFNASYYNFSSEVLNDERVLVMKVCSEIYTWNYMPIAQLQGPASGIIGEELTFSITATDPDNDSIAVRIDWGDQILDWWTELQPSGSTFELTHSYSQYGEYEIKVQIADQWYFLNELCHNSISEWSEPFTVNIFGIPEISTLTEPLDFGSVYIGEDSTKTISISNTGNGILNVNLETNTDEFSVWPESFNLEPEESLDVEVTFAPSYEGIIVDVLMILSNDPQYPEIEIELIGEGTFLVGEDENELVPTEMEFSNYPNPFNPSTTIKFSIKYDSKIELSIYNLKGQKITTLSQNDFIKGNHSIIWNGDDEFGNSVSSGIYFYKLIVNCKTEAMQKCLLLK